MPNLEIPSYIEILRAHVLSTRAHFYQFHLNQSQGELNLCIWRLTTRESRRLME
jgi:hypothetical protein